MSPKAVLPFLFSLTLSLALCGQDYYVLQVKGIVKKVKTGALIKTKDMVKADDQLTFSSPSDAVAVVSPKSGRFILKPGKPTKSNELMSYVKDALSPASTRLSTRSGGLNNILDLKAFFSQPILLLPELQYNVNGQSFPIAEKTFFFIQYQYKGEQINKQLKINSDSLLIINRSDLFKIDGKPVDESEIKVPVLYYYSDNGSVLISPVSFTLADLATVKNEIDVLVEALGPSEKDSSKIQNEILDYLSEHYGKVDGDNLKRWINQK